MLSNAASGVRGAGMAAFTATITSTERLTDDAPVGNGRKLYMYDASKPDSDPHNLTFLSPGLGTNDVGGVVGASADGHTVYFFDHAQLVAGEPPLLYDEGMFVWHDGQTSYIADLPGDDRPHLVNGLFGKTARVSPSGDLAFLDDEPTATNPVGACPNTFTRACDLQYVYSIGTHRLSCASCDPAGAPSTAGAASLFSVTAGGESLVGHLSRLITDDGRRVFFTTADALVPEDVNGRLDVYEYDVPSGKVSLLSSGTGPFDSYFMESSPSGDDALFITHDPLVGWDKDTSYDLYDARVNGGQPEPSPASPACDSEECKSPLATLPAQQPIASAILQSAGNITNVTAKKKKTRSACHKTRTRHHPHGKTKCAKHNTRHTPNRAANRNSHDRRGR